MDAQLKAKWVEALRSGEFEQNVGGIGDGNKLCCIGVGGRVVGLKAGLEHMQLTRDCADALDLTSNQIDVLTRMNDAGRKSFSEIAEYIEANL